YLDPPVDILIARFRKAPALCTKILLAAPEAGTLIAASRTAPASVSAITGS
ncbi:MAG: hypothetical protein Q9216_004790, partial [Gyalolechia sp. 2 TL-2023]